MLAIVFGNGLDVTVLLNENNKKMAKNDPTGDNSRKGAVKNRSQVLNPVIGLYVKRNTENGQFVDVKTSGGKFKGVRKEK